VFFAANGREANDAWISQTVADPGPKHPDPLVTSVARVVFPDEIQEK
jgi:hypothetical protein